MKELKIWGRIACPCSWTVCGQSWNQETSFFCPVLPHHSLSPRHTMQQDLHLGTGQSSFFSLLFQCRLWSIPLRHWPEHPFSTLYSSDLQLQSHSVSSCDSPGAGSPSSPPRFEANKNQCWNVLVLWSVLSCTSQMTQAQDIWIILLDYIYKYSEHPNFVPYTKISVASSARYSFIFVSQRIERKQRTPFIRHKPINPPNDIWNSPKNPSQTWDSFLVSFISVGLTSRVLYPTQLLCHTHGLWKERYLRAEKPHLNLRNLSF